MEKVILLNGSSKAEGNTYQILQEYAEVIKKNGFEAQTLNLAGRRIQSYNSKKLTKNRIGTYWKSL